ncbi:MAG: quinone-dependent dihydroorotate dehydrogenase [Pseudomonadota bacterium]
MLIAFDIAARLARLLPPETAHNATIRALSAAGPRHTTKNASDPILATNVAGLSFANPIGLAAGFDKNAEVPDRMLGFGFGFVEVGAVTPQPQPGNPLPRVFRLPHDQAVINRYGFNNDGLEKISLRLKKRRTKSSMHHGVLGANLGANKESADRIEDYVKGIIGLEGLIDFYTVNVSSPNTPGLRTLQDKSALDELLRRVIHARNSLHKRAPIFLKIAPDLADEDKQDIIDCLDTHRIDGLIVSNTTLARPNSLKSTDKDEAGGLSGRPLFQASTELLKEFHTALKDIDHQVPLIGVGGVGSAEDAYIKIKAGASLIQLYTALVYKGPGLIQQILSELPRLLRADGFNKVSDAVGSSG